MSHHLQVLEEVVLRGIQGQIEDNALLEVAGNPKVNWDSQIRNFVEARYMAQQVFARWRGWGL